MLIFIIFVFFHNKIVCSHRDIDLDTCKTYYTRSQLEYEDLIDLNSLKVVRKSNENLIVDFHFGVLAPSDAHILLSPTRTSYQHSPVYEIVIGAGRNTFSEIRRFQKSGTRTSQKTDNLLSGLDVRTFSVHIYNDGLIEIHTSNETTPFLSWKDPNRLSVGYFSFATWPGIDAKWYYDCDFRNGTIPDPPQGSSNSEPVSTTTRDKLRNTLLTNYNPDTRSLYNDTFQVSIKFEVNHLEFDLKKAVLRLRGFTTLNWNDSKILWVAADYKNMTELVFNYEHIWKPNLFLYSSVNLGPDFMYSAPILAYSNSSIKWRTSYSIENWCDPEGVGQWPFNKHDCELLLFFWPLQSKALFQSVQLDYSNVISDWNIVKTTQQFYHQNQEISIQISLQKSSKLLKALFYAPLFVNVACILSVLLLSISNCYRISIICFQIIFLSILLIEIGDKTPNISNEVPKIVTAYNRIIILNTLSIIQISINSNGFQWMPKCVWKCLKNKFNFKYFKNILILLFNTFYFTWIIYSLEC